MVAAGVGWCGLKYEKLAYLQRPLYNKTMYEWILIYAVFKVFLLVFVYGFI